MKTHYECQPYEHERTLNPLIFNWDAESGEVAGPGADYILDQISFGEVACHPHRWYHEFSSAPLKSTTDMSAIIGERWILPNDLIDFYPQIEEPEGLPPGAIVG